MNSFQVANKELILKFKHKDYSSLVNSGNSKIKNNEYDFYTYYLIGAALNELKDYLNAKKYINNSIEINNEFTDSYILLSIIHDNTGDTKGAINILNKIAKKNLSQRVINQLIVFLNKNLEFTSTLEFLNLIPEKEWSDELIINAGNAYRGLNNYAKAYEMYTKLSSKKSAFQIGAKINLAVLLVDQNKNYEAKNLFEEIINFENKYIYEIYINLALVETRLGNYSKAIEYIQLMDSKGELSPKGLSLYMSTMSILDKPYDALSKFYNYKNSLKKVTLELAGHWLLISQKYLLFQENKNAQIYIKEIIKQPFEDSISESGMFGILAAEKLSSNEVFNIAKKLYNEGTKNRKKYQHERNIKNKLKIGYLTADLRDHPVTHLMLGAYKLHDRNEFEVYGYDIGKINDSLYRYIAISSLDKYRYCYELDPEKIANIIYKDQIDILVDLTGYTENCKPSILFYKPAPIIVNYLGYVGTTGNELVDYIIADKYVIPVEKQDCYSEKIVYLPKCFQITDGTLPIEKYKDRNFFKLPDDKFVICAFNNGYKFSIDYVNTLSEILKRTDSSILWILETNVFAKDNLLYEFKSKGISEDRIFWFKRQPKSIFLGALSCCNVFIDTSPYNAGTTASDAIYAGCPVVTVHGDTYSSRMASSILSNVGLNELSFDNYFDLIECVCEMYVNANYFQYISDISNKAKHTSLFDTYSTVNDLENSFKMMYANFLNKKYENIYVKEDFKFIQKNKNQLDSFTSIKDKDHLKQIHCSLVNLSIVDANNFMNKYMK